MRVRSGVSVVSHKSVNSAKHCSTTWERQRPENEMWEASSSCGRRNRSGLDASLERVSQCRSMIGSIEKPFDTDCTILCRKVDFVRKKEAIDKMWEREYTISRIWRYTWRTDYI